jgi:hypothetical protein
MAGAGEEDHVVRRVDIQVMPVCKWRLPALPVLTYFKYAPLRFSEAIVFVSA